MSKVSILSHVLPPSPSGQAVVLYRILSRIKPESYFLITNHYQESSKSIFSLKSKTYTLPSEPSLHFGIPRFRNIVNLFIKLLARIFRLLSVLRHSPASALLACTGDLTNLPAAFIVARLKRISFYAYIFDDYVYQWTGGNRQFAKIIAPFIFGKADGIIGPNEFICEEYRQRYGIVPTLIRNPCSENELEKRPYKPWPTEDHRIKIIYTGAIYHANYDCFQNLLDALDTLVEFPLELHIYTSQTQEQLQKQGIIGEKVIVHSHAPYDEILKQQRKADILFLPLAFESPIPEVIRTSSPGKFGEYLASGRPVLAHVPAASFVADYCSRYNCASVAKENDFAKLAQHIRDLAVNEKHRNSIINNALFRARADFNPQQASETLSYLLESNGKSNI